MDIKDGQAFLYAHEQSLTGYPSPMPVEDISVEHIARCIGELEIDFFDPDKSEVGNSFARYRVLQADKALAQQMISEIMAQRLSAKRS